MDDVLLTNDGYKGKELDVLNDRAIVMLLGTKGVTEEAVALVNTMRTLMFFDGRGRTVNDLKHVQTAYCDQRDKCLRVCRRDLKPVKI